MINLGVNIDHVATVRNARGENHPYPFMDLAKNAIKFWSKFNNYSFKRG